MSFPFLKNGIMTCFLLIWTPRDKNKCELGMQVKQHTKYLVKHMREKLNKKLISEVL